MKEVQHPVWGSNVAHQISADDIPMYGEDGEGNKIVTVSGWFGLEKKKRTFVGHINRPATDNDQTKRQFQHRCGLLKITLNSLDSWRDDPVFTTSLDGHIGSELWASEMEFHFAPDELEENCGNPIAEIWFSVFGKRLGPFRDYNASRIVCVFRDKEQMLEYLDLSNFPLNSTTVIHKNVEYKETSPGQYESSDGGILKCLLVPYLLLSPEGKLTFEAQDPGEDHLLLNGILQNLLHSEINPKFTELVKNDPSH